MDSTLESMYSITPELCAPHVEKAGKSSLPLFSFCGRYAILNRSSESCEER